MDAGVGRRESGVGEAMTAPSPATTPDSRPATPALRRLLVPNRGEIAVRIARACREAGIESVLAYSELDDVRYVRRYFDDAISLGNGDARETYLNVGRVIDAARRCGADALHPGYGFLSERAELAAACDDAGIIFVGPKASSIAAMGSKAASRHLMQRLGVPVVPGYDGDDQNVTTLTTEASRIGFPLIVKASAGGGGKGMKIVRSDAELQSAIESAQREAKKSFGDDRLLLERYIEEPRHIEFQIFGDGEGNVVHLFERDCSIQRRHQKVIEETPAPRYSEDLRARMAAAAVAAARGVDYRSAGTVEFIVTPEGEFYFLEMNTRLQVEHPVTEEVAGVDLVRAQLAVAGGAPLPWRQDDLRQRGHAIEVRIYAEDPDDRFLPQSGVIRFYREPAGPGVRVDAGVGQGTAIGVSFDPMLAKLICSGPTRDAAIDRLARALRDYTILGTKTNISWLRRVVQHPAFREGLVSTRFIADHEDSLRRSMPDEVPAIAAVLSSTTQREQRATGGKAPGIGSVWDSIGEWGR
jgi:3-methylcrotonyl-CoA carboxylase alpha subunit